MKVSSFPSIPSHTIIKNILINPATRLISFNANLQTSQSIILSEVLSKFFWNCTSRREIRSCDLFSCSIFFPNFENRFYSTYSFLLIFFLTLQSLIILGIELLILHVCYTSTKFSSSFASSSIYIIIFIALY